MKRASGRIRFIRFFILAIDPAFYLYFNRRMIVIGLGSNVGERGAMLDAALAELGRILENMNISGRYETTALLLPDSPLEWNIPFLNMAASGETSLKPQDLLAELKHIEQKLGRVDRGRWAPREIDLDILAYGDVEMNTPELTIPHAALFDRYFALAPFAEVAPNWIYKNRTAREWLEERYP